MNPVIRVDSEIKNFATFQVWHSQIPKQKRKRKKSLKTPLQFYQYRKKKKKKKTETWLSLLLLNNMPADRTDRHKPLTIHMYVNPTKA